MKTIKTILEDMQLSVQEGQLKTPDYWIEQAINLTALWSELKDEMLKAEMNYNKLIAEYLDKGETSTASTKKVKATEEYRKYKYLENRDKVIKEYILLAKKRATLEKEFNY